MNRIDNSGRCQESRGVISLNLCDEVQIPQISFIIPKLEKKSL